jgi:spoIIIJ-associated protein
MSTQQFEGRSAADAAIKACEVLGTTRSALKYKVTSETGELLERRVVIEVDTAGIKPASGSESAAAPRSAPSRSSSSANARPAVVSIESANAPLEDDLDEEPPRRDAPNMVASENRSGSGEGRGGSGDGRSGTGERGRRGGRGRRDARPEGRSSSSESGERGGRGGSRRSGSSSGGRDRERAPRQGQGDDGIEALLKMDAANVVAPPRRAAIEATTTRAKRALSTVTDMLRMLGMTLDVTLVGDDATELHIDLFGTDEARVIGRKGEVLLALQFVLNRVLSRDDEESEQVVVLDAGGYRERRRAALQQLATKLAERSMQESKAVRLSPMSAHDRRVFHMTLKEIPGVTTRSEGDGLLRNLLIIPAEFA